MQLVGQMALNGNFELELPLIGQRAQSDSSGHHRAIQEFGVRCSLDSFAFSGSSVRRKSLKVKKLQQPYAWRCLGRAMRGFHRTEACS